MGISVNLVWFVLRPRRGLPERPGFGQRLRVRAMRHYQAVPPTEPFPQHFRRAGQLCGLAAAGFGGAALAGWWFGIRRLTSIGMQYLPMPPDTALALVILGLALILVAGERAARGASWFARCGSVAGIVYVSLRLTELMTGIDLSTDRLFFHPPAGAFGVASEGRMPFFTALIFLFICAALFLQTFPAMNRLAGRTIGFLNVVVLTISLVFTLGYLFGMPFFYGLPAIPMEFNTALAFLLLGAGLIVVMPAHTSPIRQLWEPSLSARLLRAFLPFTVALVVLVAGLTHLLGRARGGAPAALIAALLAVGAMFLAAFLCDRIARAVGANLGRAEHKLRVAERQSREYANRLEALNASLELRVAERTEELEANRDRLDQFFTILTSLQNPDNAEKAFDLVLRFCQRLGYDQAMLSLVDHETNMVRAVRAVGKMKGIVDRTVHPLDGDDILAQVAREGVSVVIPDSTLDSRCDPAAVAAAGIRGQVVMPLVSGEAVGILQVASRGPLNPSPDELRALETLGSEAARALGGLYRVEKIRQLNRQLEQRNEQLQRLAADLKKSALAEHQAQEALRESEVRLRLLLESSGEGVYGIDLEGRCTFINKSAAEMLGTRPEELLGKANMHQLIHNRHQDGSPYLREECPIYRVLATGTSCRVDQEVFWRLDGPSFPVEYSASPIREGEAIRGAVVTFNDITERKQAEQSLQFHNNLLQQIARAKHEAHEALKKAQSQLVQSEKLAALGQMVAGVAHEINNPLAFVGNDLAVLQRDVGYLRDLLDLYREAEPVLADHRPDLCAGIRALADRIDLAYTLNNLEGLMARSQDGVKRIRQIVLDLRDFARLDESDLKEVDVNAGVASTINIVRNLAKKQGVELLAETSPLPPVTCYPAKINQVVLNLVANAIHACPPGGKVSVRTQPTADGVEIAVHDTGSGIDPSIQDKIFDPFFTTKPPGQGTGLGLSISYQIVLDHGGSIEFDSDVGQGTCFFVRLPLQPAPDERARPEPPTLAQRARAKKNQTA